MYSPSTQFNFSGTKALYTVCNYQQFLEFMNQLNVHKIKYLGTTILIFSRN